jgi:hypothetical protein
MGLKTIVFGVAIAVVVAGEALAETCNIQSRRAPGEWKFVKVYDADTGEIVYQQAVSGGVNKQVTVSGQRVRIDSKLPGYIDYEAGAVALCKGGNTVKF